MRHKLIGDRNFYRSILTLTIPILIQNGISNFVNMLDNVMVGRLGTEEMTGTAVSNQLIFVFNLCIFGAISGAGIFGAQYFGKGDHEGVRNTFRFKTEFCVLLSCAGIALFLFGGPPLINLYLQGEGNPESAQASLEFAKSYLNIMLIGLIPYALTQCYSGTLREIGKTLPPMVAGIAAVTLNLLLNYVLIFGHFGAPALGCRGAAIATVISRFAELAIVAGWTHRNAEKVPFIRKAYRSLRVPKHLVFDIFRKGLPLMLNETFWAAGIATMNQCYSQRGLDIVAANNITQTYSNVFSVAFMAVGTAIGILLGQMLGAGKAEEAKEKSSRMIAFSVFTSMIVAGAFAVSAEAIPLLYNTSEEVRHTATRMMQICACAMPIDAFAHASYFTLRSGGKTLITILFDSGFVWCVSVPAAWILVNLTDLPILVVYGFCLGLNLIKCILGFIFVKKGVWIQNLVHQPD